MYRYFDSMPDGSISSILTSNHLHPETRLAPSDLPERFDLTHYFDGENVVPKQHFTIDAIPLPAVATIEGEQYELTEQPVFEFTEPGQYEVTIDAGPHYHVETFTVDYPASS